MILPNTDLDPNDEMEINSMLDSKNIERFSCFAHSLQLAIKDGISVLSSSPVLSKCSSLSNLVHHSPLFKSAFEEVFGVGRSVPVANATRWNSLLHQLDAISEFDSEQLSNLLHKTDHGNLAMSSREVAMLKELIDILQPFAEATDKAQGNDARISCVVPTVVALHKYLFDQQKIVKYHSSFVRQLMEALKKRFKRLLIQVRILPGDHKTGTDTYGSIKYPVGTVLDPQFGVLWLEHHHPGTPSVKNEARQMITGILATEATELSH
jgi:hypothetical protein